MFDISIDTYKKFISDLYKKIIFYLGMNNRGEDIDECKTMADFCKNCYILSRNE